MLYRGFGNNSFKYSWILRKRKGKKRPEGISRYLCGRGKSLACSLTRNPAAVRERVAYRDTERRQPVAEIDCHTGRGQVGRRVRNGILQGTIVAISIRSWG